MRFAFIHAEGAKLPTSPGDLRQSTHPQGSSGAGLPCLAQGWLFLAAIVDVFSRRVVGWAMADHLRTELPLEASRQGCRSVSVPDSGAPAATLEA
jgi:transposase InsO family protein